MKYFNLIIGIKLLLLASSCNNQEATITYHDAVNGYAETVVVKSANKTEIHISGQVGEGNTLEVQMRNALENLRNQLQKHGADYENLIKVNTYIADYKHEDLEIFRNVRKEIFGTSIVPASTLVGVQSLAIPEWRIEIDALAIVVE